MRKFLSILICIICLGFCSVPARANVTNQLEEILVQIENLDTVLQWFVDNEENLELFLDSGFSDDNVFELLNQLSYIRSYTLNTLASVRNYIQPDIDSIQEDIASIQEDVASLSLDVAIYFSNVVNSINSLADEVADFRSDFLSAMSSILSDTGLIGGLLTASDLDHQLTNFFSDLINYYDENLYLFEQLYTAILSLEDTVSEQEITVDIIVGGLSELFEDLESGLEYVLSNLNIDLVSSINSARSELSTIISSLYGFRSDFQLFHSEFNSFLLNWETLGIAELETYGLLTEFINWYQGYFFEGLHNWGLKHSEFLDRQLAREEAEAEHWENEEGVFYDDTTMPTDSDIPLDVQLNEVDMDVPDEPDDEIYAAADKVGSDMEEVTYALEGAMDEVDASVTSFLEDVNIEWGKFNSVLSFSFTPPLSDYTMELSYDFSELEWLPVCRSVSTGIWGIVLFINSYLAISSTLHAVIKN